MNRFMCLVLIVSSISSLQAATTLTIDHELTHRDALAPQEWVKHYYASLSSSADKEKIVNILNDISKKGKESLEILKQQEAALRSGKDLYVIANQMVDATQFNVNLPRLSNRTLLEAVSALMRTLIIVPKDFEQFSPQTHEDFITIMPVVQQMVKDIIARADESLLLVRTY